jgi:hypothetical protein
VRNGLGEEDGELLLGGAVQEAQGPGVRRPVTVDPPVEVRLGGPPAPGELRRGRPARLAAVLPDADVEVEVAEVHGEVAVQEADPLRRVGRADLPCRALAEVRRDQAARDRHHEAAHGEEDGAEDQRPPAGLGRGGGDRRAGSLDLRRVRWRQSSGPNVRSVFMDGLLLEGIMRRGTRRSTT